jgi:dTDP-4-amino-4,6-dideoxygalactose transaminase
MTGPRIPFMDLHLGEDAAEVHAAMTRVIDRGWFVLGPEVDGFEEEFAALSGATHAVGTGNGTDAIAIALRALDVGPGDEVVTTPLSAAYATCEGRPVGTYGAAGAFSFYPTKNLGALGDGGAVITPDAALAERMRRLRNGGQTDRYHHVELGVNSRLDELQAAVLRARLPRLRARTEMRRALAAEYRRRLADTRVNVPLELDSGHVYHLFSIRTTQRSALQAHLRSAGIDTLVHYPLAIPRQPAFASTQPADCPVANRAAEEVLSLPLYPGLSLADVGAVADAVRSFAGLGGRELAS